MEEKIEDKNMETTKKMCEQIDKKIEALTNQGIQQSNVDYLGKLIDVKKDIAKMKHLEMEEENMIYGGYDGYGRENYGGYGTYGGGHRRDSQGRFMEGGRGSYGRRYRGHDMLEDMSDNYSRYMENRENGRYGSPETDKAFDYMVQSLTGYIDHVFNEIDSPEQAEKFKHEVKMAIERKM